MAVTRKDIAKRARVSVTTVSHVMNHTKHITDETRERVEKAIKELHYMPNLVAKSLVTNRSQHLAFLVDNLNNPYYTELLEGAQRAAMKAGYIVSIILADASNREDILRLSQRQLDGLIIATEEQGELIRFAEQNSISHVETGAMINVNFEEAFRDAIRCLKNKGHRRVAFLTGLAPDYDDGRLNEFVKAMREEKMDLSEARIVTSADGVRGTNEEAGKTACHILLERDESATAVIAVNDLMAIGAAETLRGNGYRVPEDISLVGCDNIRFCNYLTPHLSSMDVSSVTLGEKLAEILLKKVRGEEYEEMIVTAKFIERESIGEAGK